MFGYHESNECPLDIWTGTERPAHPIGEDRHFCAIDNRAFSTYVVHQQELDNMVEDIAAKAFSGEMHQDLNFTEFYDNSDLEYIAEQLSSKYGIEMNF